MSRAMAFLKRWWPYSSWLACVVMLIAIGCVGIWRREHTHPITAPIPSTIISPSAITDGTKVRTGEVLTVGGVEAAIPVEPAARKRVIEKRKRSVEKGKLSTQANDEMVPWPSVSVPKDAVVWDGNKAIPYPACQRSEYPKWNQERQVYACAPIPPWSAVSENEYEFRWAPTPTDEPWIEFPKSSGSEIHAVVHAKSFDGWRLVSCGPPTSVESAQERESVKGVDACWIIMHRKEETK